MSCSSSTSHGHILSGRPKAAAIADAAAERARAAGDETAKRSPASAPPSTACSSGRPGRRRARAARAQALPLLEQAEDHAGLVHVWHALGHGVANFRGRYEDYAHAAEQALRHARLAGQRARSLRPRRRARLRAAARGRGASHARPAPSREPPPRLLLNRAWLLAMLARFDEADPLAREAGERCRELTGADWVDVFSARSRPPPATTRKRPRTSAASATCSRHAASAVISRPTRRSSAARSARSDATTRRSHWRGVDASSEARRMS